MTVIYENVSVRQTGKARSSDIPVHEKPRFEFFRMHWDYEPALIIAVANHLGIIPPLPAGAGRGEGESFERECHAVHGKGAR